MKEIILKAKTLTIFYTKKQLYVEQWRKRLYLLRYDIYGFIEFLIILAIIPIILIYEKLKQFNLKENQ